MAEFVEDARSRPLAMLLTVLAVIVVGLLVAMLLGYLVFHSIVESRPI